jgi:hypothetical protein
MIWVPTPDRMGGITAMIRWNNWYLKRMLSTVSEVCRLEVMPPFAPAVESSKFILPAKILPQVSPFSPDLFDLFL